MEEKWTEADEFSVTPKQAQGIWKKYRGSDHPHTACAQAFAGKVSDPHAFCAKVEKLAAGSHPSQRRKD